VPVAPPVSHGVGRADRSVVHVGLPDLNGSRDEAEAATVDAELEPDERRALRFKARAATLERRRR
jgi:hypothetical protein